MRVICRGAEAGFPCRARSGGPEVPRRPWGRPSLPLPTTRKQRGAPLSGPSDEGTKQRHPPPAARATSHEGLRTPPQSSILAPIRSFRRRNQSRGSIWRCHGAGGGVSGSPSLIGRLLPFRGVSPRPLALSLWPFPSLRRRYHPLPRARSAIGGRAARAHWPRPRREARERRRRWRTAGVWARAFVRVIAPSWSGTTSSKPYPCWGGGEEPARGFRSRLSSLSRPRFPPSLLPTLSWGDSDGRRAAPPEGRGVPM